MSVIRCPLRSPFPVTLALNRGIIFPLLAPSKSPSNIPIILSGITYNLFNAFLQGYSLATTPYPSSCLSSPSFLFGTLLFFCGLSVNVTSDYHLFHLRRLVSSPVSSSKEKIHEKDMITTEDGHHYLIPKDGLFTYVSCPNYLGEIVEWIGWAIACGSTGAGWSFAFYTVANLMPRAMKTHQWYRSTFGRRYPEDRNALIPGLLWGVIGWFQQRVDRAIEDLLGNPAQMWQTGWYLPSIHLKSCPSNHSESLRSPRKFVVQRQKDEICATLLSDGLLVWDESGHVWPSRDPNPDCTAKKLPSNQSTFGQLPLVANIFQMLTSSRELAIPICSFGQHPIASHPTTRRVDQHESPRSCSLTNSKPSSILW